MTLRVPTHLRASVAAGGPEWAAWLEALPRRVDNISARWGLSLDEPFEPGGNCAWVAPGTDRHGRAIVLKIGWQHTEARHEAEGLALLAGVGAVGMYAFEHLAARSDRGVGGDDRTVDATAMLLERCCPGTVLRERPEAEQHAVITDLLRSVWQVTLPPHHPFRPLAEMADDWTADAAARLEREPGRLDPELARAGLEQFRELARTGPSDVLLCTDLHAGNVLSDSHRGWVLIDPKPYVGDPHYDVTQHLLNCGSSLEADPLGLVREVADRAGLDATRVQEWLFARCVVESLSDGLPWIDLTAVLDRLR